MFDFSRAIMSQYLYLNVLISLMLTAINSSQYINIVKIFMYLVDTLVLFLTSWAVNNIFDFITPFKYIHAKNKYESLTYTGFFS